MTWETHLKYAIMNTLHPFFLFKKKKKTEIGGAHMVEKMWPFDCFSI